MTPAQMRRHFFTELLKGLKVVWPILFVLIGTMVVTGFLVRSLEDWPLVDGIYFAFVSGLTIGYGDLAPKSLLTRVLAIAIGVCGVLLTALVAAIAVKALPAATDRDT